jgi:hypothetical protein
MTTPQLQISGYLDSNAGKFVCIVYDFYGLELCIMYDSHVIYLRILWIIYMYKFSRCHIIIFHGFFVSFTDF